MIENKKTPQDTPNQGELRLQKISNGESTINQIRVEVGLEPIECTEFDFSMEENKKNSPKIYEFKWEIKILNFLLIIEILLLLVFLIGLAYFTV